MILGIDESSFPVVAQTAAREAATRVIDRVAAADYLGLIALPSLVTVAPTRDRQPVREAISRIAGARVETIKSRFALSASDALQLKARAPVATKEILDRLCSWPPNLSCSQEVMEDASFIAVSLEQQGMATIDGFQRMLDAMAPMHGRKTLFVISAGLPMSNGPGARPNFAEETARIGRRAASANVNMYVFYLNVHFLHFFSPAYGKLNHTIYDDISLFASGLEKIADNGGGSFFQIEVDADPFVDRALRETSATYLVTIRTEAQDRDGNEHFIRVSVKQGGVTVRYRRIVSIPRGGS